MFSPRGFIFILLSLFVAGAPVMVPTDHSFRVFEGPTVAEAAVTRRGVWATEDGAAFQSMQRTYRIGKDPKNRIGHSNVLLEYSGRRRKNVALQNPKRKKQNKHTMYAQDNPNFKKMQLEFDISNQPKPADQNKDIHPHSDPKSPNDKSQETHNQFYPHSGHEGGAGAQTSNAPNPLPIGNPNTLPNPSSRKSSSDRMAINSLIN